MEELLMCSVCIERYSEKQRPPVLLPRCGHSFCRPCIAMLISGGCIVCPTCRTDQRIEAADKLPTEYTLLAIIAAQECNKKETCERHSVKLSFWCRTCSIATCGECLFEDHPTHSHEVIRASKYISTMKQTAQEVANKFLEVLDDREQGYYKLIFENAKRISNALSKINVLRKDMEEARELMKGIKEEESITAATSLSEAAKFLGLKWNIQDAHYASKEKERQEQKQIEYEDKKETDSKAIKDKSEETEEEKKLRKEARRLLRKSRTMSSVEMMKEAEKVQALNVEKVQPPNVEKVQPPNVEKVQPPNVEKVQPPNVEKVQAPNTEIDNVKEINKESTIAAAALDTKGSSTEKLKDAQNGPEKEKGEEGKLAPNLSDKKDETKEKIGMESKFRGEEVPDLAIVKPKGRYITRKLSLPKKTETLTPAIEKKSPILNGNLSLPIEKPSPEVLSVIQENDVEKLENAVALVNGLEENEVEAEKSKEEENISNEIISSQNTQLAEDKYIVDGKLTDFLQVPGFMICVESSDGRLSGMEWGPQGLHVHCLQYTHVSYDIVIKSSVLNSMIPSKNPVVFLELTADQTILGRVYLKLWGYLRRAHNFLSLCLGDQGKSFLNTMFLQVYNVNDSGERILGGDYEHNNGRGGKGLLTDLEWNGDYAMPMEEGMITAAGSGQEATNSLFLLCTQNDPTRNFSCPFGLVCEGLKVVKDAIQQTATKQVWITDCGVVIVPPRYENELNS